MYALGREVFEVWFFDLLLNFGLLTLSFRPLFPIEPLMAWAYRAAQ